MKNIDIFFIFFIFLIGFYKIKENFIASRPTINKFKCGIDNLINKEKRNR